MPLELKSASELKRIFQEKLDSYIKKGRAWEQRPHTGFKDIFATRPPDTPGKEGIKRAEKFLTEMHSLTSAKEIILLVNKSEYKAGSNMPKLLFEAVLESVDVDKDYKNQVKKKVMEDFRDNPIAPIKLTPKELEHETNKILFAQIIKEAQPTSGQEFKL